MKIPSCVDNKADISCGRGRLSCSHLTELIGKVYPPSRDAHHDEKRSPNRREDPIRRIEQRFFEGLVPGIDAGRRDSAADTGYCKAQNYEYKKTEQITACSWVILRGF